MLPGSISIVLSTAKKSTAASHMCQEAAVTIWAVWYWVRFQFAAVENIPCANI